MTGHARFRFGPFVLSTARRQLLVNGVEVRLIPRYFDLLRLLVAKRHQAVHRQEIFDEVWADVIVSDGALSQAVRTLRRTLGDDPREPVFIRTVSRHGYQFVYGDVHEEQDDAPIHSDRSGGAPDHPVEPAAGEPPASPAANVVEREGLVARLLGGGDTVRAASDEERRDAAEQLHTLGTTAAIAAVTGRPGEAEALAFLRDARWDVPGAAPVPLVGHGLGSSAVLAVIRLRLRRAARVASSRWATASAGGATAGSLAGMAGGVALLLVPESRAMPSVIVTLALAGAVAGAIGAAGIGAGLAAAEVVARSRRLLGLVACGALGGALAGGIAHLLARSVLSGLFGQDSPAMGGAVEGLVLGACAGLGYGSATTRLHGGGMATPHGGSRLRTAAITGACCALAGVGLALAGGHLVSASLDDMAGQFAGSAVGLAPLARLLGEQDLRPVTRTLLSAFEGLCLGAGVAFGLTRRPRLPDRPPPR